MPAEYVPPALPYSPRTGPCIICGKTTMFNVRVGDHPQLRCCMGTGCALELRKRCVTCEPTVK